MGEPAPDRLAVEAPPPPVRPGRGAGAASALLLLATAAVVGSAVGLALRPADRDGPGPVSESPAPSPIGAAPEPGTPVTAPATAPEPGHRRTAPEPAPEPAGPATSVRLRAAGYTQTVALRPGDRLVVRAGAEPPAVVVRLHRRGLVDEERRPILVAEAGRPVELLAGGVRHVARVRRAADGTGAVVEETYALDADAAGGLRLVSCQGRVGSCGPAR